MGTVGGFCKMLFFCQKLVAHSGGGLGLDFVSFLFGVFNFAGIDLD
jgi:hypothetical protein